MVTIDDAIKISKILAGAPEERLPLILSVLEKAEVEINGLEELEEWKLFKDMAEIVDIQDFVRELCSTFSGYAWEFADCGESGGLRIPAAEFSAFCKKKKLRPTPTKRALAKKGYLRTAGNASGDKVEYTAAAQIDGKVVRCVFIRKEAADH